VENVDMQSVVARHVRGDNGPWLPLRPYADLAAAKLLSIDPMRGEVIALLRAPPGIELPRHMLSGHASIFTIQGRWRIRERDWVAGPGSLVTVPAGICSTPLALGDGTDDVVLLVHAAGDFHLVDDAGAVLGAFSWRELLVRHLEHCAAHDMSPTEILSTALPVGCR
jgi:hypothetical protein